VRFVVNALHQFDFAAAVAAQAGWKALDGCNTFG